MPQLKEWSELPVAGALAPAETVQPATGGWRTEGRPVPHLSACVNCLLCWLYCPDSAIVLDGATFAGIDYDFCKGCALCVEVCPVEALSMEPEDMSVGSTELIKERRRRPARRRSGQ